LLKMFNYQTGFWIVFGFILAILSIFIWLCVRKNQDDRIMQISSIGLGYLVNHYLNKSFQKVCVLLLRSDEHVILSPKIKSENIMEQQDKFIQKYRESLTKALLKFVRGQEIVEKVSLTVSKTRFEELDLFVFPDTLIDKNEYYRNILLLASEKTLAKPINKSNQESKEYIDVLAKKLEETNVIK